MPGRCVVGGCSVKADVPNGIILHKIPFWGDDRREAKKRRKKWVDFVKQKRVKWEPTKHSSICSQHFTQDSFMRPFTFSDKVSTTPITRRLNRDDFGVTAVPTVHAEAVTTKPVESESAKRRKQRATLKNAKRRIESLTTSQATASCSGADLVEPETQEETPDALVSNTALGDTACVTELPDPAQEQSMEILATDMDTTATPADATPLTGATPVDATLTGATPADATLTGATPVSATPECAVCARSSKRNRMLRNQLITAKTKLKKSRQELKKLKRHIEEQEPGKVSPENIVEEQCTGSDDITEMQEGYQEESEHEATEEEPDFSSDGLYETETETDTASESEADLDSPGNRVYIKDGNLRTQPKFIVFLSQLLLLFKFCHSCKADNPLVKTEQVGTMAVITSSCTNKKCNKKDIIWKSQPLMNRIPAGNFLLCLAILLSGSSASKVLQLFQHMGLACFSLKIFFKHQREKLFPTIHLFWKSYQEKVITKLKEVGKPVVIAGDGRHDSMGHSAKYGAYTIFCCTIPLIVHFSLVQRNVAGSSPAMEFLGFKNCMAYLLGCGLVISTLITDRHGSVRKYMREQLKNIKHYFDLWHIKKKIHKVLTSISKESGCSALINWIRPCENHFYWSVTSTLSGNGNVIYAKFKSFLSHVINKHDNLDEPLYNRCNHGEISHRTWLDKDSPVYEKMHSSLTNASLVSGIKQASPEEQTSCLEGFHSTLNHFSPKMIAYSFIGMYCRHIIAALHFNFNLHRDVKKKPDGTEQVKVVWPKFKNGEATVRDVKVEPNFDYVEDVYQAFLAAQDGDQLMVARQELSDMSPPPMNTMLEKQSREESIKKRTERKGKTVIDVPPTAPVTEPVIQQQPTSKARPHCSICKQPMKGHKNVLNCPRNQMQGHQQ